MPPASAGVATRSPSAPESSGVAVAPASPAEPPAPAAETDPVSARLAAGRDLLAQPQRVRYAVQLLVTDARERAFLEQYLGEAARALPPERLFLVPAGSPDAPRVGLLYGAFRERGEANAALGALPQPLRQFRPYVRTLEALRDEARRAEARPAA